MGMTSTPRRVAITTNALRAAQIGATMLRQRSAVAPVDDPTEVRPFPASIQERSKDIAVRLRFLLARQSRGDTQWGSRLLVDAIADCRAELHQAKEQESGH